ncbi:hypothetical protein NHP22001_05540 [Helicobacter sp. NHP22-001]|nr:hypothetical protein NHP22001_05540 [Helicobacter sp. NHP22-001]
MTLNHVLQMLKQQKKLVETYKNNLFKDLVQKPPTPNSLSITGLLSAIYSVLYLHDLEYKLAI